jgi:ABC-type nitrate/sulfonate/bicarbonate transport system substrate-binding protein
MHGASPGRRRRKSGEPALGEEKMGFASKWKAWVVAGVMLATAGDACAQTAQKVTMGLAGQSIIAAIARFVDVMGLFSKHGLDVSFVTLDSANASASAMIGRSIPYAFAGPGELVTAQGQGQKAVVLVNTYSGLGGSLVLSKSAAEKTGITANAPLTARLKALDGMTIASPSATSAYTISFKTAAESAGVKMNFTYMAMPAMVAALQSGAIQGYVASAPFWVTPILNNTGTMWISGPGAELPAAMRPTSTAVLLTMRDTAEADPATARKLIAAFADFVAAIDSDPAAVKAAFAKTFPSLDAKTIDLLFATESLAWKAKPLSADDILHEIAFVKSTGARLPQLDGIDPAALVFR